LSKTLEKIAAGSEILFLSALARVGNLKMGRTYQIEPDSLCDPAARWKRDCWRQQIGKLRQVFARCGALAGRVVEFTVCRFPLGPLAVKFRLAGRARFGGIEALHPLGMPQLGMGELFVEYIFEQQR
jgi:hypothetical protein